MAKNRICPDLARFLDRIFAIYPKIFLHLKKSYFSEQILFLLTFPENFESYNIIGSRLKCAFITYISPSLLLLLILDLDTPVVDVSSTSPIEGETVNFTCNVNTNDIINGYGWYYNGTQISGARSKEYSLTNGNRSNSGYYSCNVTSQNFIKSSQKISVVYLCKYTFYVFVKVLGIAVAGILEFLELFLIFLLLEFYLKCHVCSS